jgi:hypothetical protein
MKYTVYTVQKGYLCIFLLGVVADGTQFICKTCNYSAARIAHILLLGIEPGYIVFPSQK